MENVSYGDSTSVRIYMEVITWATWFGLVFPLIFFLSNKNKIPQAILLYTIVFIFIVLTFFLHLLSSGKIFPQISPKWIRRILYGWGYFLLILAALIIYYTGGIQSSIFVWLLEYALVVLLIVRPKNEQKFFEQWRPVLIIGVFEVLIIAILVCLGGYSIRIPNTMDKIIPFWGGCSIGSSLITTCFLFWISTEKLGKNITCTTN